MRVTNKMLSNNFLRDMNTNINNLKTLQEQMTSGKEIRRPSDNPFKVARAMQMHTDINTNAQYNENISDTINWLDTTDTALGQAGNVLQRVRELLVSAGNAAYDSSQRKAIKDEINQKIGEFAQILNTSFDGRYIFGGTRGTVKPVEVISNKTSQIGAVTKMNNGDVVGGTPTVGGAYTGAADATFQVKSTKVDATGKVMEMYFSKDGGTTWNTATPDNATSPTSFTLSDGLNISVPVNLNNRGDSASPATAADIFTFTASASNTTQTNSAVTNSNTQGAIGTISGKLATAGTTAFQARVDGVTSGKVTSISYSVDGGTTWTSATPDTSDPVNFTLGATGMKFTMPTNTNNKVGDISKFTSTLSNTNGNNKLVYYSGDSTKPELAVPIGSNGGPGYTDFNNINSSLVVEVSQGVTFEYNVPASDIMQFSIKSDDGTTKSYDLRALFGSIVNHLDGQNDDGTAIDPKSVSKITGSDLQGLTDTINNLLKIRSEVGAKQNRMDSAKDKNSEQNYDMTEILSHTEDIDITQKTMEYATMQTVYMASLQTSAKVLQPTLMDYLR